MDFEQEALAFIERLQTRYPEQRDLSPLLPAMNENASWTGAGAQEFFRNLKDARATLSREAQEYAARFTITDSHYDAARLAENACVIYGTFTARPEDIGLADVQNRLTAVCVRIGDGIKLAHLHLSTPSADPEDGQREALRLCAEKSATASWRH